MSYRIAEEIQLLAEEKWLLNALTKTRNQRNCLQIEKLHLKSLKAKHQHKANKGKDYSITQDPSSAQGPSTSAPEMTALSLAQQKGLGRFDFEKLEVNEENCNKEKLDLVVTKPVYNHDLSMENMEEYDEEDADNVLIDINMLMNGKVME